MGASVLWSYIDLYGTEGINKVAFIDEPPSIYSHADWSEKKRLDAGAITSDAELMIGSFTSGKMQYPQSMIYPRDGVDLDRAQLAGWAGAASALQRPLDVAIQRYRLIAQHQGKSESR